MNDYTLTIEQADQLGQLVTAVRSHGMLRWYVNAASGTTFTLRAFVVSPADMSFMSLDTDIRDGAVWVSGIFDRAIPVREILTALDNASDGEFPLAVFEGNYGKKSG